VSRDIRRYWQEIRALEAGLPEFVWLTAGSVVAQVTALAAARLLHAGTHRLATDAEVQAHHSAEEETARRARRERLKREGRALVLPTD
jgi:hypothetical protein